MSSELADKVYSCIAKAGYLLNNQVDENFMFKSESFVQNRLIPIFILEKKWSSSLL